MPAFSFALGKKTSSFSGAFTKSAVSFGTEIFNEKPSSKRSATFFDKREIQYSIFLCVPSVTQLLCVRSLLESAYLRSLTAQDCDFVFKLVHFLTESLAERAFRRSAPA